jgi:iron complex outermembrane recepter protein
MFPIRIAPCAALLGALLLAHATAGAQARPDTAAADSARRVTPVLVSATRAPVVVGGASAVVAVPDSLRVPPAPTLEQVLRELPFVLVRQNSRGEMEVSTRGSDSRQTAVALDGLPLTLGWDHRTDPSVVPLTGAQSIVLVRGLASLLHGPNVLGGLVEVGVARGAVDAPARQLSISTGADHLGSHAIAATGSIARALGAGSLSVRAGAGRRARDALALAVRDTLSGDDRRANSDLRHEDVFVSGSWTGAGGAHVGVTASGYRAERGVPPELHVEEPRLWRYPSLSRTLAVVNVGTGRRSTAVGRASLDGSVGYTRGLTAIEAFTAADYATVDSREWGDERAATARLRASLAPTRRAELRAALTGADVRYRERLDADPEARYRQRLWSAAGEAEVRVATLSSVSAGVALDGADTPETGGREPLDDLRAWGARLGASTIALGTVQLHASVSRRSRFPALRELYSGALDRFQPNPNLRPETLLGAEAGATTQRGAARFQGVLFHHRLRDAVVRTTLPDRRFLRVNRDQIRSTGAELLASWARGALELEADATLQRVQVYDQTAGDAERRAEHQPAVRLGSDLRVPLPLDLRAISAVRYTGRQYCLHPDLGRQVALAGRARADAGLERSWSLARGAGALLRMLRASAWVENAADSPVYDQCGLPQPGRTVRFALELR